MSKEAASYLLSVIGVTNTAGRVFFGWLADKNWVTALTINNFALLACGLLIFMVPFLTGYVPLMMFAGVFGFFVCEFFVGCGNENYLVFRSERKPLRGRQLDR